MTRNEGKKIVRLCQVIKVQTQIEPTALQFMRNITGLVPFKVFLLTFKEGVD